MAETPVVSRLGRKRADSQDRSRQRTASIAHSITLESYLSSLGRFTPASSVINLTYDEVVSLVNVKKAAYGRVTLTPEDHANIAAVEARVDEKVQGFGSAVVKLATRTPRDVMYETVDIQNLAALGDELAAAKLAKRRRVSRRATPVSGAASPSRSSSPLPATQDVALTENEEVIAFLTACERSLSVTSGKRAVELLTKSTRVFQDLLAALEFPVTLSAKLVVTKSVSTPLSSYYRGFVSQSKLNAITQLYDVVFFENCDHLANKDKILKCFEMIKELIPKKEYIIDFQITDEKVLIIDLHPFTALSSPGLFSWREDRDILRDGPFEFRYRKEERENVLSVLHDGYRKFVEVSRTRETINPIKIKRERVNNETVIIAASIAIAVSLSLAIIALRRRS